MRYLELPRAQGILLLFLASSLLLVWFPGIDLQLSGWFFRGGAFPLADAWWTILLHQCVGPALGVGLAALVAIYGFNRLSKRNVLGVDGRVVGYLVLVLALGAGLVVNVVLKNGFGRARPRNVIQFGGSQEFTPAFVVAGECASNCSFSSGDGAGAFFSLALALAAGRRRAMVLAATLFGSLVSFARIAAGAHFLSDTVVSFFVMWIAADVLYVYLFRTAEQTAPAAVPAGHERLAGWDVGVGTYGEAARPVRLSLGD